MGGMGGMGGMMGGAPKKKRGKSQAELAREAEEEAQASRRGAPEKIRRRERSGRGEREGRKGQRTRSAHEGGHKGLSLGRHYRSTRPCQVGRELSCWPSRIRRWLIPTTGGSTCSARRSRPTVRWTKWENVSSDENLKVLDNLPEVDEELTLENVRPTALVDPLPFLKAGLWEKVHIASLVPKEKKEIPKSQVTGGMMGGMMGRMMGGDGWHGGKA